MFNQLQKIIDLAKKTGDRIIVVDNNNPNRFCVVMGLDQYENLVMGLSEVRGLTKEGLIDKINRDVAIWKSEQTLDNNNEEDFYSDWDYPVKNKPSKTEEIMKNELWRNRDKKEKEEEEPMREMYEAYERDFSSPGLARMEEIKEEKGKERWRIPSQTKEGAEEIIEEDRQYLEEITF